MKTFAKSIAALLVTGCSFVMNVNAAPAKSPLFNRFTNHGIVVDREAFTVSLEQIGNTETVRVFIYKQDGKRLFVTLKDQDGNSMFSSLTERKGSTVATDYNFAEADQGDYTLEVSDGKTKVKKQIKLQRIKVREVTQLSVE